MVRTLHCGQKNARHVTGRSGASAFGAGAASASPAPGAAVAGVSALRWMWIHWVRSPIGLALTCGTVAVTAAAASSSP